MVEENKPVGTKQQWWISTKFLIYLWNIIWINTCTVRNVKFPCILASKLKNKNRQSLQMRWTVVVDVLHL